jgi:hypothetical protein
MTWTNFEARDLSLPRALIGRGSLFAKLGSSEARQDLVPEPEHRAGKNWHDLKEFGGLLKELKGDERINEVFKPRIGV